MQAPLVRIIRRVLIGVICAVTLAVSANYLIVALRKPDAVRTSEMISSELKHAAEGVEILIRKGSELRFTIHALRLRETIDDRSYLEGIEASDFNRDGSVRNSIRSEKATYDPGRKTLDFSEDVHMSLDREIELRASSLHYDLNAETGIIPGGMELFSRSVSGRARGVSFFRNEERLEFSDEVDFSLNRRNANSNMKTSSPNETIQASAGHGTFLLSENHILLADGVRMESPGEDVLSGDSVIVELNPDRDRIISMTASGRVVYEMQNRMETRSIGGNRVDFATGTNDSLDRILISGQAYLNVKSAERDQRLSADEIDLMLDAATGEIMDLTGKTDARFQSGLGSEELLATGDVIHAVFTGNSVLREVRIDDSAQFSQVSTAGGGKATNELQADTIQAHFRTGGVTGIQDLTATGAVRWTSSQSPSDTGNHLSSPNLMRTMTASKLEIRYATDTNSPESGEASGGTVLEENDVAARQLRRLAAEQLSFHFFPGIGQIQSLTAEQNVRTTYERAATSSEKNVAGNYETSSSHLEALFELRNRTSVLAKATQWGSFRFRSDERLASSGRCEYEAASRKLIMADMPEISDTTGRVSGERMEYDLDSKSLLVHGGVRAVLNTQPAGTQPAGREKANLFQNSNSPTPIVVTSKEMRYRPTDEHLQFVGDVLVLTDGQQLHAQDLAMEGSERMTAHGNVVHRIWQTDDGGAKTVAAFIESSDMEYRRHDGNISYLGNVLLKSDEFLISADTVNVLLDEAAENFRSVSAVGKVVVRHEERVVRGDMAEWDPASGSGSVVGDPAEVGDPARGKSFARRVAYVQDGNRITLEP